MNPLRILAAATAIELCFMAGGLSALCLAGASSGWLDLINTAAPLILPIGLLGAGMALAWLEGRLKPACIVVALLAAAVPLIMLAPDAVHSLAPRPAASGPTYKVVMANVFRDNASPFGAAHILAGSGADALLLQEEDSLSKAHDVIAAAYPFSMACPGGGVGIWLKTPILDHGCSLPMPAGAPSDWGQEFVWVRTMGPGSRVVTLASVHLGRPYPPGRQAMERLALARAMGRLPKQGAVVLGGDFNTVPWTFAMRAQDRALQPLRRRTWLWPTWPGRINLLNRPWPWPILPIDHLYTSAAWAPVRQQRLTVKGSDHVATRFELGMAADAPPPARNR